MPTVAISPLFNSHHHDNNGRPASGWLVYTYYSRTTQKKDSYKDPLCVSKHENPITLDSRGEYPGQGLFLISGETYSIVLKDPNSDTERTWHSVISGTGGIAPVATSHTDLSNRDIADQHPQSAITGLTNSLASKLSKTTATAQQIVSDLDIIKAGANCGISISESAGAANISAYSNSGTYAYSQANTFGAIQKVGTSNSSAEKAVSSGIARDEYSTATKKVLIDVQESGAAKIEVSADDGNQTINISCTDSGSSITVNGNKIQTENVLSFPTGTTNPLSNGMAIAQALANLQKRIENLENA